jgi:hypothetical protein
LCIFNRRVYQGRCGCEQKDPLQGGSWIDILLFFTSRSIDEYAGHWQSGGVMKKIVLGMLLAGLIAAALNYHVIVLDNRIELLEKIQWTFKDTYVDARGAKKLTLLTKPNLIKAGIKDLLK